MPDTCSSGNSTEVVCFAKATCTDSAVYQTLSFKSVRVNPSRRVHYRRCGMKHDQP